MKHNLIINENYARYVFKMIEFKENNKNRMKVMVVNKDGEPLMPCSPKKARLLLKSKKAYILNYHPFTIKLKYNAYSYTQLITLGMDIGSKYIGISCSTIKDELLSMELQVRNDINKKLFSRRQIRRTRRNRKTRYRKCRFLNRKRKKGWLAPSIRHKIDTHINIVKYIKKYLPITNVIIEIAEFDIQKINNPEINGADYQNGLLKGFENVREYVLYRDKHTCQCCQGKSKDKKLNIHHIKQRSKSGSNKQDNLITLCETCHKLYHKGLIDIKFKIPKFYKHQTFMNTASKRIMEEISKILPTKITYGYITKSKRIRQYLPKTHYNDAYCIANNLKANKVDIVYKFSKITRHNRQFYKATIYKGGKQRRNNSNYVLYNFRNHDTVKFKNKVYEITNLRSDGYIGLTNNKYPSYKHLFLLKMRNGYYKQFIKISEY